MDLMLRRRQLMAMQTEDYIRDGLVLWLDAIDRGGVTGSWVDIIGGHIFQGVNNPTFGPDYVATSQSDGGYLINETFPVYSSDEATIEVAISDHTDSTQIIFMPKSSAGGIAFGLYNNTGIIWCSDHRNSIAMATGVKTASIRYSLAIVNGQSATLSDGNVWSGGSSYNHIGRRSSGNTYTGKIHAIRIYNRRLSESEMLHNQKLDNKRFNLGLNI